MPENTEKRWSEYTERALREAGWHPDRAVSTAEWEKALSEHVEISEAARKFLAEFGGLVIERREVEGRKLSPIRLNPLAAKEDEEIFEELGELAGVELYPIGETNNMNMYLGMSADGSVYGGMDQVTCIADSGDAALEKMIT